MMISETSTGVTRKPVISPFVFNFIPCKYALFKRNVCLVIKLND
jgi:hypothetical protein